MIEEAFREDKHFIVAKIQSRSEDRFDDRMMETDPIKEGSRIYRQQGNLISNLVNAYGILKLIFKKKNNIFYGRFSEPNPVTTTNPITNKVSYSDH